MAPDLERIVLVDPSNNSLRPRVCSPHRSSGSARSLASDPLCRAALCKENRKSSLPVRLGHASRC